MKWITNIIDALIDGVSTIVFLCDIVFYRWRNKDK